MIPVECPDCDGTGVLDLAKEPMQCPRCKGEGVIEQDDAESSED
jgi:DnaJ-class molecular chaperone